MSGSFELSWHFELLASLPTFLHPIETNKLARRSSGVVLDPSVDKSPEAFFPWQPAFICAAFSVASLWA
jgi:hypothetical protein